jgi:hypothetical protein
MMMAVVKPKPDDAMGNASMPAPIVVPAMISMQPIVLFIITVMFLSTKFYRVTLKFINHY